MWKLLRACGVVHCGGICVRGSSPPSVNIVSNNPQASCSACCGWPPPACCKADVCRPRGGGVLRLQPDTLLCCAPLPARPLAPLPCRCASRLPAPAGTRRSLRWAASPAARPVTQCDSGPTNGADLAHAAPAGARQPGALHPAHDTLRLPADLAGQRAGGTGGWEPKSAVLLVAL